MKRGVQLGFSVGTLSDILRQTVCLIFLMRERFRLLALIASMTCIAPLTIQGQASSKTPSAGGSETAERGISLASKGLCKEALPLLKKSPQVADKDLKYDVLMSTARCAMSLDQTDTAVRALLELNRTFPRDPEVLFNTTHYYSDLASRASQELAASAPTSAQAEQLEAESLESQGDFDKAATEYRKILEQYPQRRGIHYRLGRLLLSKTPPDVENAKKELNEELKADPNNAAAEFVLGETARQAGEWDDAVAHFSRASKIDVGFQEAYLALGMSLNSAGRFADAVSPLETYVKLQPADPAGHYQLGTAYARTGHKQEAQREMALQQQTAAKSSSASSQP
jgi:tetratricopeptide (TPR) repeat protein